MMDGVERRRLLRDDRRVSGCVCVGVLAVTLGGSCFEGVGVVSEKLNVGAEEGQRRGRRGEEEKAARYSRVGVDGAGLCVSM